MGTCRRRSSAVINRNKASLGKKSLYCIILYLFPASALLQPVAVTNDRRVYQSPCTSAASASTHRTHSSGKTRAFAGRDKDAADGIGIGIDLGTTFSAVAYLNKDGVPEIIPVPHNGRIVPSVVSIASQSIHQAPATVTVTAIGESKEVNSQSTTLINNKTSSSLAFVVGKAAIEQETTQGAYRNVKRVLGTGGCLPADILQGVPYVVPSPTGKTYKKQTLLNQLEDARSNPTRLRIIAHQGQNNVQTHTDTIAPELVSSQILTLLKQTAEQHTGHLVTRAVIGVPAYFNDAQRDATITAARMAGLERCKLLREPEAAALAYGMGKEQAGYGAKDELVLVFDLGGGTFDVSMLLVGGGLTEIICTSGNAQLGGTNFDQRIAQYCFKLLGEQGVSWRQWPEEAKSAVLRSAEAIRIRLSNQRSVAVALPKSKDAWEHMSTPQQVILTNEQDGGSTSVSESGVDSSSASTSGSTISHSNDRRIDANEQQGIDKNSHVILQMTRTMMENLCKEELQALIRPVREVAIMSGALLPGDASPTLVDAALQQEEEELERDSLSFEAFYNSDGSSNSNSNSNSKSQVDSNALLQLEEASNMKAIKKAQQSGRRRARTVAKEEKKFRTEKRKLEQERTTAAENIKVRDGITGTPISRIVLVGGATRMPVIGRLLESLTGKVPQRTVNPDEAVALGCAVHVGVLDGKQGMGTVLNPMQAAILKALAQQQMSSEGQGMGEDDDDADYFDDTASLQSG
jgi:molecular chaperone DnaK (HSP70)